MKKKWSKPMFINMKGLPIKQTAGASVVGDAENSQSNPSWKYRGN